MLPSTVCGLLARAEVCARAAHKLYLLQSQPHRRRPLQQEDLVSLAEAAAIAKLHPDHLRKLAQKGYLRARKIGGIWVTSRQAIAEYLGDSEMRSRDPYKRRR